MNPIGQLPPLSSNSPTIVMMTPRWGANDEVCWAARQVAGAIACSAEVHIITKQGKTPGSYRDGVFTVHELASADRTADRRRDLVLAALRANSSGEFGDQAPATQFPEPPSEERSIRQLLVGATESWEPAIPFLTHLAPEQIVLADYREVGAVTAIDKAGADVEVVLLPLAMDLVSMTLLAFEPVFDRAASALVFTEAERTSCAELLSTERAEFVGLPLSINPSVEAEPEPHAGGERDYVLLILGRPLWPPGRSPWIDLLRARFPSRRLVISASDLLVVYAPGEPKDESQGMERASDLLRLMAWAHVTLDLRPGSLLALRSLQSLMYGTPIIVPEGSRARLHAQEADGGLWFAGPGDTLWCVEAIFDQQMRDSLGRQGAKYVKDRYTSADAFIDRVTRTMSLD